MEKSGYWLYLEPYVFMNFDLRIVLVYNSISGEYFKIEYNEILLDIVRKLSDIQNMYSVYIDDFTFKDKVVYEFYNKLRDSFSGDIISVKDISKPVILPPICNIQNDIFKGVSDNFVLSKYLNELHIDLSNNNTTCQYCNYFVFRQLGFGGKENFSLTFDSVKMLLKNVPYTCKVFLFGLNLFECDFLGNLISYLYEKKFQIVLKICLEDIICEPDKFFSLRDIDAHIYIDSNQLKDLCYIEFLQEKSLQNNVNIEFVCGITSENEYYRIVELDRNESLSLAPIYNGSNIQFLKDFIYISEEDLKTIYLSRNNIFVNENLNVNTFGKLYCLADGNIYSNLNVDALGDIYTPVNELIKRELEMKTSWFTIRNNVPICLNCAYNQICPSPSNYEFFLNKYDLCHLKSEIVE